MSTKCVVKKKKCGCPCKDVEPYMLMTMGASDFVNICKHCGHMQKAEGIGS